MKYAEKHVGQPIVVVNKPGGGGEVGWLSLLASKPDGYTISTLNLPALASVTNMRTAKVSKDDLIPICTQVEDPRMIAVRANDDRINSYDKFMTYGKNQGEITIGTSGANSAAHFAIELFNQKIKDVKLSPVHFGGAGQSMAALLGGHIDSVMQTYGEVFRTVEEGKIKVIVTMTRERIPVFDAPTFKERGSPFDIVMPSVRGYAAPKGTPMDRVKYLEEAFRKGMEEPGYIADMKKIGLPIKFLTAEETKAVVEEQDEILGPMIRKTAEAAK